LFIPFVTGNVDAVDYYCYWKLQDALMDCALNNQNCDVAFGNTAQQKNMGNWGDGTPVHVLEITPASPSAVVETSNNTSVQVYPNPSNGRISVTVSSDLVGSRFVITDRLGSVVLQQQVTALQFTADIQNLAAGVYFYQVINSNGIAGTGKVIVD
jgi:hypothetical protein